MKIFRFLLPLLCLAGALRAQQYDNPVSIPIAYYGNGNVTYIPTGQSASFSFGASLGAVSSVSSSSAAPGSMIVRPS